MLLHSTPVVIVKKMADERVCNVCYTASSPDNFFTFSACRHSFCKDCVSCTFAMYIREGKTNIQCLQCPKPVYPQEVGALVNRDQFVRYLDFSLRRHLTLQPNVRRCIAPDCPYLYILENPSSCSDDHFICPREECGREFCARCKRPWHEGKSCQQARAELALDIDSLNEDTLSKFSIKPCPRCHTNVEKQNDGSCNQIHCTSCNGDFCWLCLQPITEMHFLSPTGCPLYGAQRWSSSRKWCFRISLWMFAPLLLVLLSMITFVLTLVLLPILVGFLAYKSKSKPLTVLAIIIAIPLSPFIAMLLSFLVYPLGLFYIYLIIPIHLMMTSNGTTPQAQGNA